MEKKLDWRAIAWVMHYMTVNRLPRTEVFKRLRALGLSRREAALEIQCYERGVGAGVAHFGE